MKGTLLPATGAKGCVHASSPPAEPLDGSDIDLTPQGPARVGRGIPGPDRLIAEPASPTPKTLRMSGEQALALYRLVIAHNIRLEHLGKPTFRNLEDALEAVLLPGERSVDTGGGAP